MVVPTYYGMAENNPKPVDWVGSSYKDFRAFPDEVQDHMGYALHLAQIGAKHEDAKPLRGGSAGPAFSKSCRTILATRSGRFTR
jgi:hypothetical protein